MKRLLLLQCCIIFSFTSIAGTIFVKNIDELTKANKEAKPGDVIVLQNGEWKDVTIALNCTGTKEQPITFKAETTGKVTIDGHSQLKLGGTFIVIDGWYFTNGYAGDDAVIDFRIDKKQLANNCRLTNTVINDFNNPKRMQENYWISLSGKNNRIDHCSFFNKKNMGVLMAVILDDDRSRENFHSVDHNYFGFRLPLASNSGEIIRIGVSQHCKFNSNTQVVDNFFEHCDGETEIVSVKSCGNVVRNNLFKECQGGVVLRHGNYNTVENNIFLGNGKEGTGGVRIINKGQWVVNNLFYKCRGVGFRSPLSIMNGVPNSPDFRYVAVTDAVIANNSFVDCTPISLCEGSDTERTVVPAHVQFANNIFYNTKDPKIYNAYDDISAISFSGNLVSSNVSEQLASGFIKTSIATKEKNGIYFPVAAITNKRNDSLDNISATRLVGKFSAAPGFVGDEKIVSIENNAYKSCGAKWYTLPAENKKVTKVNCANTAEVLAQLNKNNSPLSITLTGNNYAFAEPITITGNVTFSSNNKKITFSSADRSLPYLFEIKGGSTLNLANLNADLSSLNTKAFISADISGSVNHSNFSVTNSGITNLNGDFYFGTKSTMLDSIVINNSSFSNIKGTVFNINNETDKKGYYNVENFRISNSSFSNNNGQLLGLLRGGNDESTMGPLLIFSNNKISNAQSSEQPLINLYGVQRSFITNNNFTNSSKDGTLLKYDDAVRAVHFLSGNKLAGSGNIITDKFVKEKK